MTSRMILALVLTMTATGPAARAATVALQFTDTSGNPVADAVIELTADKPSTGSPVPHHVHIIDQRNETFFPYVEVLAPGDDVTFRNSDRTRHHVYSFSPLGLFEFLLAPGDVSPPVHLVKPGVIAVGCNIHDQMITYLYIAESGWTARSDPQGVAQIHDVPAGTYVTHIWHPRQRPGSPPVTETLTVGESDVSIAQTLALLPDRRTSASDRRRY